jgi:hypothetical protein
MRPLSSDGEHRDWLPMRYLLTYALVAGALLAGCDRMSSNPALLNGWVTNCVGPPFERFGPPGPGVERPVFKLTNELVLAVPRAVHPSANAIQREPRECRVKTDLPEAQFLDLYLQGNWSEDYPLQAVPVAQGLAQFRPDLLWVHLQRAYPDLYTPEEWKKIKKIQQEALSELYFGTKQIGGLTCLKPKFGTGFPCTGKRSEQDPDITALTYYDYANTSFVLVAADYNSSHYGGVHVHWQIWINDVSKSLTIDRAVWNLLSAWNLLEPMQSDQQSLNKVRQR